MPPAGFEAAIPANEPPQTHALDSAATRIGLFSVYPAMFWARLFLNMPNFNHL
jgi:hypothetical protein